jgi:hypothetical protein
VEKKQENTDLLRSISPISVCHLMIFLWRRDISDSFFGRKHPFSSKSWHQTGTNKKTNPQKSLNMVGFKGEANLDL